MNDLYQQALTYWRGLAARERMVLIGGGALAVVLLFYGLLWTPLQRDLDRLRAEVPKEYEQLQWMRAQADRITQLRTFAPSSAQRTGLLSFVEQSAQAFDIRQSIRRVEPDGANAVRLTIDGVAFNDLIRWLENLQKQGGVRIENASLEPAAVSGTVNVRLLLRTTGS